MSDAPFTAATLDALRAGVLPLSSWLDELEDRFQRLEPGLQAFVPEPERFTRLRRDAKALGERFPEPADRPPLFGVPLGVKDIFHVDGFLTRAGSRLPPAGLQGPQASSVARLRAAGALILGKTVTTEFAYFAPGPTRNPRQPGHTPGGSSSGSAAAVAAGLCPLALGTQTIGSIIRPASFCGTIGYKPTYDFISRDGVIPLAPSLDHVGLFAATPEILQAAAAVLVRPWPATPTPPALPAAVGVPDGPYLDRAAPEMLAHVGGVCDRLVAAGIRVQRVPAMADFAEIARRHDELMAAEAARVHADWFAAHRDQYHPRTAALIERGQEVTDAEILAGRASRLRLRRELEDLMERHGLALWLAPAAPGPAPEGLESTGDPIMNLPWTHAGMPALALPTGAAANGLPLGCQFVARWGQDSALLSTAAPLLAATAWEAA